MNGWKKWIILTACSMILGLISVVYYQVDGAVKDNKKAIVKSCEKTEAELKEMDKKKVDNQTMQMQIQLQQQQIDQTNKNFERIYDEIKDLKK